MTSAVAGRTIVITGGSSGIGAAAARELRRRGARVAIAGRSPETTRLAAEIGADAHLVDYASLASVRTFAATLLERYRRIDVLVNNAGAIFSDRRTTVDGHELTLQVNHLAGFLLTNLLRERLEASKAAVINTSSAAHLSARLDFDDLENERRKSALGVYGLTKLMNLLHAMEIPKRFAGVSAAAFHPGPAATGFARDGGRLLRLLFESRLARLVLVSPERGADTLVWLASGQPGHDWASGEYYAKRLPARRSALATEANARALWEASERLVQAAVR